VGGRAARDGAPAQCALFYRIEDRRTQRFFMVGRYPSQSDALAVYDALPADGAPVTLAAIRTAASGVAETKVRVALAMLKEAGSVVGRRGARYARADAAAAFDAIERAVVAYEQRLESDRRKLETMERYAQIVSCRWKYLLDYFEPESVDGEFRCGTCDACRGVAAH
jgi:ATP-dependent DNA helicase RecQ